MKEKSKKMLAVFIVIAMIIGFIPPMMLTVSASVWNGTRDTSWYAKESIAACLKEGIINGTATGILSPKSYTTRAEAAVMIQRMLKKAGLIN